MAQPMFFSEPRRRSFPHEATSLEILATRVGIDDEELRLLLQCEIEHRRSTASAPEFLAEPSAVDPPAPPNNAWAD